MSHYPLKEQIYWTNKGYICKFTDPSTDETYSGYSTHSPQEARHEAIEDFKTQNPGWNKKPLETTVGGQ